MADDEEDRLRLEEMVPAPGGTWCGLLFDNPSLHLAPSLTWAFAFPFQDVTREDSDTSVSLDIEWLPVPVSSWRHMAGQHLTSTSFGEPAEASVYFYEHHRFEAIHLHVLEQRDQALHVSATVSGDMDGLGIEPVTVNAWLTFTGILVALHDAASPDAALERLSEFTDTTGLAFDPDSGDAALRFVAQDS